MYINAEKRFRMEKVVTRSYGRMVGERPVDGLICSAEMGGRPRIGELPPESWRLGLCVDNEVGRLSDGVPLQSEPPLVYVLAPGTYRVPGPFPDIESAYLAQGDGVLPRQEEVLPFASLGKAERFLGLTEGNRRFRREDCYVLALLDGGMVSL